jgi:hypothetical protein
MQRAFPLVAVLLCSLPVQAQLKPLTPPGGPARMGGSVFPPQGNSQAGAVGESSAEVLNSYRGFSRDGRWYAYGETSGDGMGGMLSFKSVNPADTAPEPLPLETDAERKAALTELQHLGFPRPGQTSVVPPDLASSLNNGRVSVTMRGMPLVKPFAPFAGEPDVRPLRTSIVAASPDGQYVAVRTQGEDPGGTPVPPEHDLVNILTQAPRVPTPTSPVPVGEKP